MSYAIRGLCPRTDIDMGHHGFRIDLSSEWPTHVAVAKIQQSQVDRMIENEGGAWLDACGYGGMSTFDATRRVYEPRTAIRVQWGKWGPEHISVPGNACGLDIETRAFGCLFAGGAALCPHNIDSWRQKQLLLIVFTSLANDVLLFARSVQGGF